MFPEIKVISENDKRFYKLAQKLDKIILKNSSNSLILNNQLLHLTRNHPEYLDSWKPIIFSTSVSKIEYLRILLRILRNFLYSLKLMYLELFSNKKSSVENSQFNNGVELLIVSHLVQEISDDGDLYYGDLMAKLKELKLKFTRLLIPQSLAQYELSQSSCLDSILLNSSLPKSVILKYTYLNLISVLRIIHSGLKFKLSLYEILVVVSGQVNNFINYKLSSNIELAILRYKPSKLIITFEGNAIERSVFSLCHKYGVESLGYQHAPIIKSQYSIFRSLGIKLDPDIVLSSGPYTKNLFLSNFNLPLKVKVLGSQKNVYAEVDLNNVLKFKSSKILLAPDGNIISISKFIELGIYLSTFLVDYQVSIRAHPLFDKFLKNMLSEMHVKKNFDFSVNSLESDLVEAKWVIYENSSVAIQAGFYGCQLIYLDNLLSNVDPLFDLEVNKFTATSANQVYQIVEKNRVANFENVRTAQNFCNSYFSPYDLNSIL
jgi:hypothetical protein